METHRIHVQFSPVRFVTLKKYVLRGACSRREEFAARLFFDLNRFYEFNNVERWRESALKFFPLTLGQGILYTATDRIFTQ